MKKNIVYVVQQHENVVLCSTNFNLAINEILKLIQNQPNRIDKQHDEMSNKSDLSNFKNAKNVKDVTAFDVCRIESSPGSSITILDDNFGNMCSLSCFELSKKKTYFDFICGEKDKNGNFIKDSGCGEIEHASIRLYDLIGFDGADRRISISKNGDFFFTDDQMKEIPEFWDLKNFYELVKRKVSSLDSIECLCSKCDGEFDFVIEI